MEKQQQLKELFNKWLDQETTDAETRQLMQWLAEVDVKGELLPLIDLAWNREDKQKILIKMSKSEVADKILNRPANAVVYKPTHRIHFLRTAWFRYAAAAILIIAISTAVVVSLTNSSKNNSIVTAETTKDIVPGTNRAILTLADGSTIALDNAANGELAQQGNAAIVKLANGQIAYNLKGVAEGEVMMNTMSTPRGGQYQLLLPDGSKVWLNAASSITYPAVFVGNNRKIKITGEAYLEVAQNKAKPFIVDIDGKSSIEVLGTSFNINSYADEATIKTTLVEGSVKVIPISFDKGDGSKVNREFAAKTVILKPGYQAIVVPSNRQHSNLPQTNVPYRDIQIQPADIDQTLAWKNGFFDLQDISLQEVARQLERWYDIKVKYEGNLPDKNFEGKFNRDVRLSTVLSWFSELGIKNRLEGRTLTLSAD